MAFNRSLNGGSAGAAAALFQTGCKIPHQAFIAAVMIPGYLSDVDRFLRIFRKIVGSEGADPDLAGQIISPKFSILAHDMQSTVHLIGHS
jgi:hypothetical protein